MSPLLEQFLSEARDFLQGIGEKVMELEDAPGDEELMTALFRMVHTLKGNSGLFEFREMTRVLHAGEDLMDAVRHGRVPYSKALADRLLEAMDFVGLLCDEVEGQGGIRAAHAGEAARLAESLRLFVAEAVGVPADGGAAAAPFAQAAVLDEALLARVHDVPEPVRMEAFRALCEGESLIWLAYAPDEQCFFAGDDPLFQARGTPALVWGGISAREPWPELAVLDAYRCLLDFHVLTLASAESLDEHYRYVPDQIRRTTVPPLRLVLPEGSREEGPPSEAWVAEARALLNAGDRSALDACLRATLATARAGSWSASTLGWLLLVLELRPAQVTVLDALLTSLQLQQPPRWLDADVQATVGAVSNPVAPNLALTPAAGGEADALRAITEAQRQILQLPPLTEGWAGRTRAAAATLAACLRATGADLQLPPLEAAAAKTLETGSAAPLLAWLDAHAPALTSPVDAAEAAAPEAPPVQLDPITGEVKNGRRADDQPGSPRSLKVDQAKIDRLMNLIGEMVVSKNALPYLAGRAEELFGVRELALEIMAQYTVINRIAEEMQDAIMQVRMLPVSFVFQRFPRLVRDISRKLGKEVNLVLEGEETEADKNIIESLSDPLVHIVRNSLDHGFELPADRQAAGKPRVGTLTIRATQESDRVIIEIRDDGKGIDPAVIRRKAYEKGLIDEATLERLTDQEAVNLVFAPGFSTMDAISDLSGRGVGMDVVRTAIDKVNGTVTLDSTLGRGTTLRLSLPLSMAVSNVMVVESDGQLFGMPMDSVVETVRVPRSATRTIKQSLAAVLRGRIVPLKAMNELLGLSAPPKPNADEELAVLVVRLGDETVGLLVDDFRGTADIILKPMTGVLTGLSAYAGSALMGDGSVLMVLNVKELI